MMNEESKDILSFISGLALRVALVIVFFMVLLPPYHIFASKISRNLEVKEAYSHAKVITILGRVAKKYPCQYKKVMAESKKSSSS